MWKVKNEMMTGTNESIDRLACCGNCEHRESHVGDISTEYCNQSEAKSSDSICPKWNHDGAKVSERLKY